MPSDIAEDLLDVIKATYSVSLSDPTGSQLPQDYDAEAAKDWDNVIYVNADVEIDDGRIMEYQGRRFRIRIEEVTPLLEPITE
jgi:hypothetical protein